MQIIEIGAIIIPTSATKIGQSSMEQYLKGRNFDREKFWREENLTDLAEFNLADAEKL